MVHRPCGQHNKNSPCMVNGRCSKFFPKGFRSMTIIDDPGFAKYRRRDDGRTITKRRSVLDNSYIVPYNPKLLLKYGCHINVKYTCQTSPIKYLFKYVYKGNDRVTTTFFQGDGSISRKVDEIHNCYDCRYISVCEASFRLFGFDIQVKEPVVIKLLFHLSDHQPIVFQHHEDIPKVSNKAAAKRTMLLAWMEANTLYSEVRNLAYA